MTSALILDAAPVDQQSKPAAPKRQSSPFHHGSHRRLLSVADVSGSATAAVDAIVVPTARPSTALCEAGRLAKELGCALVVLCSGKARADETARTFGGVLGSALLALDVPRSYQNPLLRFGTRGIQETLVGRRTDTSLKRNIGLLLARLAGWERIVFLDDDIAVGRSDDIGRAVALLDRYDNVGLSIGGFPDNSVVCRAHRVAGGWQETFVGGGALAVAPMRETSFFPEIYNEDWFFLLDRTRLRSVAITGNATQHVYDPFAHSDRARSEEFGDVLAEGVFWLLDQGRWVKDAKVPFWTWFLKQRRLFIDDVIDRVGKLDPPNDRRAKMLAALAAAQAQRSEISPTLCHRYLRAWDGDRTRWQRTLAELPTGRPLGDAVRYLEARAGRAPGAPDGLRIQRGG